MSRTLQTPRAVAPPARAATACTQELGKTTRVGESHKRSIKDFWRKCYSHFGVFFFLFFSLHFPTFPGTVWGADASLPTEAQCCGELRSRCDSFLSLAPPPSVPFPSPSSPPLWVREVCFQSPQGRELGLCPAVGLADGTDLCSSFTLRELCCVCGQERQPVLALD